MLSEYNMTREFMVCVKEKGPENSFAVFHL